jgi:hypothetical protein
LPNESWYRKFIPIFGWIKVFINRRENNISRRTYASAVSVDNYFGDLKMQHECIRFHREPNSSFTWWIKKKLLRRSMKARKSWIQSKISIAQIQTDEKNHDEGGLYIDALDGHGYEKPTKEM